MVIQWLECLSLCVCSQRVGLSSGYIWLLWISVLLEMTFDDGKVPLNHQKWVAGWETVASTNSTFVPDMEL